MAPKTMVVAMSGGVDSSVVAGMMVKAGYRVIGITLQLYDHGAAIARKGACCAGQDIYDAKMVADKLGIPHYVFDYEDKFRKQVIEDFADSYIRGETPLPCVRCNQTVKFNDLLKAAKELQADGLATGHYVQKIYRNQQYELHQGVSLDKDQSYFLFATTQEQLNYLEFPLGNYTKEQTRDLAKEMGLEVADKPDSQDICFVAGGNYRDVVTKLRPESQQAGSLMHVDGFKMGTHQGIINYTIGQRRGIGISSDAPLYVVKIDPEQNIVYVGPKSALVKKSFLLKEVNWLINHQQIDNLPALVKVRSTTKGVKAILNKIDDLVKVELLEEETAITPGQACVFYSDTQVMGGGWIMRDAA